MLYVSPLSREYGATLLLNRGKNYPAFGVIRGVIREAIGEVAGAKSVTLVLILYRL